MEENLYQTQNYLVQIYFGAKSPPAHTQTLQTQHNLSIATKSITLSNKWKLTFHGTSSNFIGGTKVSEIHNELLISDIKPRLVDAWCTQAHVCIWKKAQPSSAFYKQWDFPESGGDSVAHFSVKQQHWAFLPP